jgi:hypothetical protein
LPRRLAKQLPKPVSAYEVVLDEVATVDGNEEHLVLMRDPHPDAVRLPRRIDLPCP